MQLEGQSRRLIPNILVTGTPGTGKTTFCHLLNQSLNFIYVSIGQLVIDNQLYTSWNQQFNVPEFSEQKIINYLLTHFPVHKGGIIFDFHTPDVLPQEWIDLIALIRCSNDFLYRRLQQRGYSSMKITVNIQCEIFDEIKNDIKDYFKNFQDKMLELCNQQQYQMQVNLNLTIQWLLKFKQKNSMVESQN